jgi:RNA polymerase sigma factor (sigma-70 family)
MSRSVRPPDLATVYDDHVWDVYGFLAYRLGRRADAEDLTQQTFERALRAWSRFDPDRASAKTWLLTIARNLLIDHYRATRTEDPLETLGTAEPTGEMEPDLGLSPQVAAALTELSPRDREIVALRFGGDLTGPEIAEALGLSLANVQQILSRSLRRLRVSLEGADLSQ